MGSARFYASREGSSPDWSPLRRPCRRKRARRGRCTDPLFPKTTRPAGDCINLYATHSVERILTLVLRVQDVRIIIPWQFSLGKKLHKSQESGTEAKEKLHPLEHPVPLNWHCFPTALEFLVTSFSRIVQATRSATVRIAFGVSLPLNRI